MHSLRIKSKICDYTLEFVDSIEQILNVTNTQNTITFIDNNIASLYPEINNSDFVSVVCDEEVKTLAGAEVILNELIRRKANSKTKLVAIGGGILQDLIG